MPALLISTAAVEVTVERNCSFTRKDYDWAYLASIGTQSVAVVKTEDTVRPFVVVD